MRRRKKHVEEPENLERWLVSYADFITLLFAFFTVLYALSQTDQKKYKKAVENIQRSFLSAGGIHALRGAPFVPFNKPLDRGSEVPPSPEDSRGEFSKAPHNSIEKIRMQIRGLYEKTTGLEMTNNDVSVYKTETGWKIRLGEYVLFKAGNDKISPTSIPFLYEMGKRLKKLQLPVQVEGHADQTIGSSEDENWDLSMARAYNVMKFLVAAVEFPKDKLSMASYGDTRPVASNDTVEGRARNRRVELSIAAPDRSFIQTLEW